MRRLVFLLPLTVLFALLVGAEEPAQSVASPAAETPHVSDGDQGRLVVLIIDSLRRATLEADGVMPELLAFAEGDDARVFDVTTCAANFTYPCLQTMFEGRQSPFVAGLHNFTGRASDARSVPSDLEVRGRRIGMASNISLVSLYGQHAAETLNVEDWPIGHLERDLRSIDVVLQWLDDDEIDDLFVHLLGTDKAAHHERPGTEGYNAHFRKVDARSMDLVDALDLSRDHLIITGDHGHDEDGHHTRDSVAIMAGPLWNELFEAMDTPPDLDQTELTYFMSYAMGLELPLHYEGRYFVTESDVDVSDQPAAEEFVDRQRRALAAAGYDSSDLKSAIAEHRAQAEGEHGRNLLYYLPLLAAFLFWLVVIQGSLTDRADPNHLWAIHLVLAASCLLTWAVASSAPLISLGLSAVYAVTIGLWVHRFGGGRFAGWAVLLLAATAIIGLHVNEWAEFFHTRGGFVTGQPVFYTGLPLVGLAVAWLRYGDWKRAPEGAMAFCLFCLPSGVYYYQFGQNMFWGFLLAAALVTVVVYVRRLRGEKRWPSREVLRLSVLGPASLMLASMVLLLMQESGGWEWEYFPVGWLQGTGETTALFLYAALAVYLAGLMRRWAHRLVLVTYMVASVAFSVAVGQMSIFEFVAAHTVVLFIASWLAVGRTPLRLTPQEPTGQRDGLVLFGALLAMAWFLVGGFFIHNIDFHFAFEYFGDLQRDRDIFAGVFAATLLKYGLPTGLLLLVYRLMRGADAFERAVDWVLLFAAFLLLATFVQIFFAAVGSTEKLYELAIAQLIFAFSMLIIAAGFSTAVSMVDGAVDLVRRQ